MIYIFQLFSFIFSFIIRKNFSQEKKKKEKESF